MASVSCIYGLGSPEAYYGMLLMLETGQPISRREILSKLVEILYERNDLEFRRGAFRGSAKGDRDMKFRISRTFLSFTFAAALVALALVPASAGAAMLTGRVTDARSGEAVQGGQKKRRHVEIVGAAEPHAIETDAGGEDGRRGEHVPSSGTQGVAAISTLRLHRIGRGATSLARGRQRRELNSPA